MKNMRKGLALLLSFVILVGMMPMHVNATETVPETTGETVSTTTGETVPETTGETVPELVKVSCTGQYMDNGELIDGNDTISAVGADLVSISAIWEHAYDDLLTGLYGCDWFSPYAISVEGYVPGEPITISVEMAADILLQENVAVYYIDADGNHQRIENITVREIQHEELLFTEVEFTVTNLGVFAVGNEPGIHYWYDDSIDFYACAMGLTGVSAVDQKATVDTGKTFSDYICYTIVPEGADVVDYVSYAIAMPKGFDMDNLALYAVTAEGLFPIDFTVEDGVVCFEYFGEFTFACGVAAIPEGYPLTGLELTGTLPADCFVGESITLPDATVTAVYAKDGDEFRRVLHPVASVEEDGYMVVADTSAVGETMGYVTFGTATVTFPIQVHQQKFEDNETGVRVDVDAFGTTGVSVTVLDNAQFDQSPLLNHVENFVAYDIDLTGYQQGDTAVVTLPIPEGMERPAVFYVSDDGMEVVRMPATVNGDGTISFETNHFSTYALGDEEYTPGEVESEKYEDTTIMLDSQTATRPGVNTETTIWVLSSDLGTGNYLIVNSNTVGITGHALGRENNNIKDYPVNIVSDDQYEAYINDASAYAVWTVSGNYQFKNGDNYLRVNNSNLQLGNASNATTFTKLGQKLYYYYRYRTYYLRYNNNEWSTTTSYSSATNLYFYKETKVITQGPAITYSVVGTNVTNAPAIAGHRLELTSKLCETVGDGTPTDITESAGITPTYEVVEGKGDSGVISIKDGVPTLSGKVGTAVVRVTYASGKLVVWDEFVVTTTEPEYKLELSQPKLDENGNPVQDDYEPITAPIVKKNVQEGDTHNIWAVITANGEDIGKLTDAQLEKLTFVSSNEDIATVDPKTGEVTFHGGEGTVVITAVYEYQDGKSITDTVVFSVSKDQYVVPEDGTNDFPEYPNEGSIRYDKHATAVGNFADTGMVQVELSMTGVPFTAGSEIDVVIMLDISTSMVKGSERVNQTVEAAQEALKLLVTNEDGTFNGNRVAIYGFCGWDTKSSGNNEGDYTPYVEYIAGEATPAGTYNVYQMAGLQSYDQLKLTAANSAIQTRYNNLGAGTNYAAALKQCYETLDAARTDGIGNSRDQYVIFMTDGSPTTGFAYRNNDGSKSVYAAYDLTSNGYNATNDWGSDTKDVTDLVKLTEYYSYVMKNGGVEIYTVAMQIYPEPNANRETNTETAHKLLENIASDSDHALVVGADDDPSKVVDIFQDIAQEIKQAATDVKVTDKIAADYTMVFDAPNTTVGEKDGNQDYYIEVKEYQLNAVKDSHGNITDYTRGEYASKVKLYMGIAEDGEHYYAATAAGSTNGQNKFADPAFDTKPLGSMGTRYYWTTDQAKGDSGITVTGADGNTYHFLSTGEGTHNMISGAYAYGEFHEHPVTDGSGKETGETSTTSRDLIIATPYFVYNAKTRMLVWTADKLSSTELALNYFLFLDKSGGHVGSHDEKPAGTYETNDYATLQYTNFQDNRCEQKFPVPQMTWNGAQVSYVFYLVNKEGQPVNRAGRVVPFSEAVYVTDVFTYSITWNELETSDALEADRLAKDLVPDVYKLYDEGAAYKIHVYEDQNQANLNNHFLITNGEGVTVNTTYVYNTKSDAVKYTTPGVHAESTTYLCRGEREPVATKDNNGNIISFSYKRATGETQKRFATQPHGAVFYDSTKGFAYFEGKDENGNKFYYTIVEKESAETVAPGFDFSNTTVAFAVMWLPELKEDAVVIDFGLDVVVDVTYNDALTSQVLGVMNDKPSDGSGEIKINEGTYGQRQSNNAPINLDVTIDGNPVTVGIAYADSQSSVRVSLDKSTGMLVKDPLQFYYESEVSYYSGTNSETLNTAIMYSSVTVIPATTIYYEDEYVTLSSESKETGSWQAVIGSSGWDAESKAATETQSSDRPGANKVSELYDADNLYGYDPAYSKCSTYSLGNAAKFTANPTKRGVATFEFYGTGFDVIATTSNTTGTIIVKLYPWENGAYSSTAIASYIVDTYYGYTYEGTDLETGEAIWKVTTDPNALYQVPVMKLANKPYGRYKAEIQIRYSPAFDHTSSGGSYEFYLDAIRVYDPAGDDPTNETVKDAYKQDGESWPVYAELRDWIIDAGTYDTFTGDNVTGAVFIDGKGSGATVEDYRNFGPNNELYLATDQAVSFHLDGRNAKTIQLAMKSVGGTAKPQIWYIENGVAKEYKFHESNELSTATDMYYDITALKGKDVLIQNNGEAILSITNVKMTFEAKEDKPATAEETAQVMRVSRSGTQAVLMFLRTPRQDVPPIPEVPETTVPETTVPETTVPETTVPETTVPETTVPETTVPETTVPETTVPETTVPETTVPETTVPEATAPKNPTSKPTGNQSTETDSVETTPAESESTIAEITELDVQISDDPEIAATEEPEQEQNIPPVEEQQDSFVKQDSPEVQKTVWEMIVDWFASLINFIVGLFSGRY